MTEQRPSKELITSLMADIQSFASAWSLIGSSFDDGGMLHDAEQQKAEIQAQLEKLLSTPEQPADHSNCPFCDQPCDDTGSIWHRPQCEGLQDAKLTKLQHHMLVKRAAQPPAGRSFTPEEARAYQAFVDDYFGAAPPPGDEQ
jgi:hypothetical protein